jgi:hypothetical protein
MVYTNLERSQQRRNPCREVTRILACCAFVCASAWPAVAMTAPAARVRSTDATLLELLREGAERSATFHGLTDAIAHSTGIVYVEFGYCAFGHVNGCLLPFIASTHGDRYLRILVTPDKNRRSHDQLLALIAHELQHALEVIAHAEVVDVATMEAMFSRIGTPLTDGITGYETAAARAAGDTVLSELLAQRRAPRRSRLVASTPPSRQTAADEAPGLFTRVSSTERFMIALIRQGHDQSPAFRDLVDVLQQSNVIVFVQPAASRAGEFDRVSCRRTVRAASVRSESTWTRTRRTTG